MATNKKLATGDIQVARAEKQVSMWSARLVKRGLRRVESCRARAFNPGGRQQTSRAPITQGTPL
jgi:hypothetical protein